MNIIAMVITDLAPLKRFSSWLKSIQASSCIKRLKECRGDVSHHVGSALHNLFNVDKILSLVGCLRRGDEPGSIGVANHTISDSQLMTQKTTDELLSSCLKSIIPTCIKRPKMCRRDVLHHVGLVLHNLFNVQKIRSLVGCPRWGIGPGSIRVS